MKTRTYFTRLIIFLFMLTGLAQAGTVQGTVLDSESGDAISEATIYFYYSDSTSADTSTYTIKTNADGYYSVNLDNSGSYYVVATAYGYDSESFLLNYDADESEPYPVNFSLTPQLFDGYVTGKVINTETKEPIVGADIRLHPNNPLTYLVIGATDENGVFVIEHVPPAEYTLKGSKDGYFEFQSATPVSVESGDSLDLGTFEWIPFNSEDLGSLSGIIYGVDTSGDEEPLEGAYILLFGTNADSTIFDAYSLEDGSYVINNITPGTYHYAVTKEGYFPTSGDWDSNIVTIEPTENTKDIYLQEWVPVEKGTVNGTVSFDDATLSVDATVTFIPVSENGQTNWVHTEPTGNYVIELHPGEYIAKVVYALADSSFYYVEWYDDVISRSEATVLNIEANEVYTVDFSIPSGMIEPYSVTIEGRVTDDEGNPLEDATFMWVKNAAANVDEIITQTDAEGKYSFTVNDLRYPWSTFLVAADEEGYQLEFYKEANAYFLATNIVVNGLRGDTTVSNIDFTLSEWDDTLTTKSSISGTVVDTFTVAPIRGAIVSAINAETGDIKTALTNEDGSYTLQDIAAGRYYLFFDAEGYFPQYYFNAMMWENATLIDVYSPVSNINGALMPIDLAMDRPGVTLTGVILDESDYKLQGALVVIMDTENNLVGFDITDQSGAYTITGTDDGDYHISATKLHYNSANESISLDKTNYESVIKNITLTKIVLDIDDSNKDGISVPTEIELLGNYPNPFNPTTEIRFSLPNTMHIRLAVYNVLGQQVAELINGEVSEGYHDVTFNAAALPTGIYFYAVETEGSMKVRKMLLQK